MQYPKTTLSAILVVFFCFGNARSQSQQSALDIQVVVPNAPTVTHTTRGGVLAYELYITGRDLNSGPLPTSIKILKDRDATPFLTLTGDALAAAISKPTDVLNPSFLSSRTVVYMWVPIGDEDTPKYLRHRLTFTSPSQEIDAAEIAVKKDMFVIGPPVRGDNWLVGNGPSNDSAHRRFIAVLDNLGPNLSQRFAIDFQKLGGKDVEFADVKGDEHINGSYYSYGEEVIAVADGRVVAIKDGLPENTPRSGRFAVPLGRDTASGNRVVVDLGNGRFASFAHLQPGSIKVKVGEKVVRGQALARIGNSGRSTGPHLHFQIMDGADVLFSEGLPYVFDSFVLLGTCDDKTCFPGEPRTVRKQIPVTDLLVSFPK